MISISLFFCLFIFLLYLRLVFPFKIHNTLIGIVLLTLTLLMFFGFVLLLSFFSRLSFCGVDAGGGLPERNVCDNKLSVYL